MPVPLLAEQLWETRYPMSFSVRNCEGNQTGFCAVLGVCVCAVHTGVAHTCDTCGVHTYVVCVCVCCVHAAHVCALFAVCLLCVLYGHVLWVCMHRCALCCSRAHTCAVSTHLPCVRAPVCVRDFCT